MIYKYSPNSIDYKLLKEKNIKMEEFLQLQIKYRENFESFLKKLVSFESFDKLVEKENINLPPLEKDTKNFYYKFSTLNSKYLFLRNNIHIERLDEKDLKILQKRVLDGKELDTNFILKTFKVVLFESGDQAMFGVPLLKNLVNSKSLIFELAYDDKFCTVMESKKVREFYDKISNSLKNFLEDALKIEVNFILNDGF